MALTLPLNCWEECRVLHIIWPRWSHYEYGCKLFCLVVGATTTPYLCWWLTWFTIQLGKFPWWEEAIFFGWLQATPLLKVIPWIITLTMQSLNIMSLLFITSAYHPSFLSSHIYFFLLCFSSERRPSQPEGGVS